MNLDPTELLLRPVAADDLDELARMACASAHGINSLPEDRDKLRLRIERSLHAFASEDAASGEETYLFVLQHGERLVGTSGIAASAGFHDRFYSYRNEFVVHASAALATSQRMHTLHLCHDLTGATLLTSFYLDPGYEHTLAPQLLSRARLLFIDAFAERFDSRIAAETPGLADEQGHSPFWDAVGRHFFAMDYPQAEVLAGGRSRSFIAELMPHAPIYVALLPEGAQWAIGQLHPVGELPFNILVDEGFEPDTYIDIFDGGPTVLANLAMLRSVRAAHGLVVQAGGADGTGEGGAWHIVVQPDRAAFRATLARLPSQGQVLPDDHELARRWQLQPGRALRVCAVDPQGAR